MYKWVCAVQTSVVQGQLYIQFKFYIVFPVLFKISSLISAVFELSNVKDPKISYIVWILWL